MENNVAKQELRNEEKPQSVYSRSNPGAPGWNPFSLKRCFNSCQHGKMFQSANFRFPVSNFTYQIMTKPLTIFLIALTIRLALFLFSAPWQTEKLPDKLLHSDGLEYHKIAVNLATRGIFTTSKRPPFNPRLERVPIYPGYLAALYKMGGIHPWLPIFGQLIISALSCVILYHIGVRLFNPTTGFIAALLFAVDFTGILISNMLLSDTLFVFLFLLHIYFFTRYAQPENTVTPKHNNTKTLKSLSIFHLQSLKSLIVYPGQPGMSSRFTTGKGVVLSGQSSIYYLLLSAFFLGLATLTHPVSIYFIVILIPFILWRHHTRLQKAILHLLLFTFTFLLLLTPWTLRHYNYKNELLLSSQQKEIFWWNTPQLKKSFREKKTPASVDINDPVSGTGHREKIEHSQKNTNSKYLAATEDLLNYGRSSLRMLFVVSSTDLFKLLGITFTAIPKNHPTNGISAYLTAIIYQKHPYELFYIAIAIFYLCALYLLALLGSYKLFKKKRFFALLLFSGIIFYFILAAAPAAYTAKYRLPLLPVMMLSAAYAITAWYQHRGMIKHLAGSAGNGVTITGKKSVPNPHEG